MKNAKNQAGSEIYATVDLSAINEDTLDDLFTAMAGTRRSPETPGCS